MKDISTLFKESLDLLAPVIKRAWFWIMLNIAFQGFSGAIIEIVSQKETPLYYSLIFLVFSLSLILSTVGVILINQLADDAEQRRHTDLLKSLSINFKQSMIESLRALLPILSKALLLLIPGIVEAVRLYWIIYVVQFDENYKKGTVDALEKSRELTRGRFWKVGGVLLFTVGLSMLPKIFGNEGDVFKSPLRFAIVFFAAAVLEIYGDIVLYKYYRKITERIKLNGTSI